ncbi:PREDICTED: ephrin-B1-like [Priapulus caudatus]|uniref:Ephrin-B1-like n=1 Tax=Priapulus caudatus TaxID=37621 RepID=A0ABM1EK78_PRICU|nr:PREDICTED: ephrin-B1-like [Priapulus caudatus]XP_014672600.1 PREDICTED: ephrin-B1-like [Priapulus caudatus]XP_014672601.1 PREDICTED: ephrin-B1-like [Priapulus caudatus]XP_014672602.1 PREDICTED: ephrin-B1-like [Priapulus caudatus]
MSRCFACLCVAIVLQCLGIESGAVRLLPVYWNASNPIFRRDNTDHVFDVAIGDALDIVCPRYPHDFPAEDAEYHVVYQVSREDYSACRVTPGAAATRQLLVCNRPHEQRTYTLSFREFTPVPRGLEYRRGADYYYLSTSSGAISGMHERSGGACAEHNMRVVFKVCCEATTTTTTTTVAPPPRRSAARDNATIAAPSRHDVTAEGVAATTNALVFSTTKKSRAAPDSHNDVLARKAAAAFLNAARPVAPSIALVCVAIARALLAHA